MKIKTAFVLGAGLGTRLRPLTNRLPKPLVPVCGKPLITYAMDHLIEAGVERFIINTHHAPEAYEFLFGNGEYRKSEVVLRYEPVLLETGGGVRNIDDLLGDEPFWIYNGDILTDLPLAEALRDFENAQSAAHLILRSDGGPLHVACNEAGCVTDIRKTLGTEPPQEFLFTGISIGTPELIASMPERGKFSLVQNWLALIPHQRVTGSICDSGEWDDLGTLESYLAVHARKIGDGFEAAEVAVVESGAHCAGGSFIDRGALLSKGAHVNQCVIGPGARIEAGAKLDRCVVLEGAVVCTNAEDTMIESSEASATKLNLPEHLLPVDATDLRVEAILKGGSEREFHRIIHRSTGDSWILMRDFRGHMDENDRYAAIAEFLSSHGIRVPKVLNYLPQQGILTMQDLGKVDLWTLQRARRDAMHRAYEHTLEEGARLHSLDTKGIVELNVELMPFFDEHLYLWEQSYFIDHCLGDVVGWTPNEQQALRASDELHQLAKDLAALPMTLVHRDFQSQNILIHDEAAYLIDFQGMRLGRPEYDIASLLYDPYVRFPEGMRESLIEHYKSTRAALGTPVHSDFDDVLLRCALQRLMQALGAYGFLGLTKNRPRFLNFVQPALASLDQLLAKSLEYPQLAKAVKQARDAA